MITAEELVNLAEQFREIFIQSDYLHPKIFESGEIACIMPLMFTAAIIYDLDLYGYGERWCYKSVEAARTALDAWDGTGEPEGWHRHPNTGRRRDEDGVETINF